MSVTWVEDLPADVPLPGYPPALRQTFHGDPRFDKDWREDERLYGDVKPIPFFPDDLPTLGTSAFGWTQDELRTATDSARAKLFPLTP